MKFFHLAEGVTGPRDAELEEPLVDFSFVPQRILSTGQKTPEARPYCNSSREFVLLLAGEALLAYEEEGEIHEERMVPGTWTVIPAGVKHWVRRTQAWPPTLWLVGYEEKKDS